MLFVVDRASYTRLIARTGITGEAIAT
jgi:hypothetical protein